MLIDTSIDFGMTSRDMETINCVFKKYPEVKRVLIFGSRAKGTHKQGSDIDLAIMNEGIDSAVLMRIKSDLEDSTLPYTVDIIDFTTLTHADLKEHISRVGKEFYKSWELSLFSRYLLLILYAPILPFQQIGEYQGCYDGRI